MTATPRLLRLTDPKMRGEDVRLVQQRLAKLGFTPGAADGVYGVNSVEAVKAFQAARGLAVDGMVGPVTLAAIMQQRSTPTDWRAEMTPLLPPLMEWHTAPVGAGTRSWKLGAGGIAIENAQGLPALVTARLPMVQRCWQAHRQAFIATAIAQRVPVELLLATACTESGGRADAVREEPGFVSDEETPHRVSPGMMQTLISTAREALRDPAIDRAALLRPEVSLAAGAAFIRRQAMGGRTPTGFDPPLVAIAYNAGSLRLAANNPWGMVQTRRGDALWHADEFVACFNAAWQLLESDRPAAEVPAFVTLLSAPPQPWPDLRPQDRKKLAGLHPHLVRVVERARRDVPFIVVEGLRSAERQRELVARGASKTMNSRHLTGHAVDLVPWVDDGDGRPEAGELRWDRAQMVPVVDAMKRAAAELGVPMRHGHDWGWDSPHHELDRAVYP